MSKEEYFLNLRTALTEFDTELVQEIITDYEEHFKVGAANGKSEETIIEELGSIEGLVRELRELSGTNAAEEGKKAEKKAEEQAEKKADDQTQEQSNEQTQEEKNNQSHEYRYERNYEFDFDHVMKNVEKALDQAGRAVDQAMKQASRSFSNINFEFGSTNRNRKEKNSSNNATWTSTQQNQDMKSNETKKTESYEENFSNCRKVVVASDYSDITIMPSSGENVQIDYEHNSYKDAMLYPLYYYQKDDCLYVGTSDESVNRQKYKSGFFHVTINTKRNMGLSLKLPKTIEELEISVADGDVEIDGVNLNLLKIASDQGDVDISNTTSTQCSVSVDCGDISINHVKVDAMQLYADSSDIQLVQSEVDTFEVTVDSGDIEVNQCRGNKFVLTSDSGDINIDAVYQTYMITVDSGDVNLNTQDADITTCCDSGDINVVLLNSQANYRQNIQSDCGKTQVAYHGQPIQNGEVKSLNLSSDCGDINVSFQ